MRSVIAEGDALAVAVATLAEAAAVVAVAATEAEATAKETAAWMAMHMRAGAVFRVVGR